MNEQQQHIQELWLRECLRTLREGQPCEPMLEQLEKVPSFDFSCPSFQSHLVSRVLHDPQQAAYPPNRFQAALFWTSLIARLRARLGASGEEGLHEELRRKEQEAEVCRKEKADDTAPWYRNYEVAAVCNSETTTRLRTSSSDADSEGSAATEGAAVSSDSEAPNSVLVLPTATAHGGSRCYPIRVVTGCMAHTIGRVMWPAAFCLAEFAMQQPHLFRGKRVLELGAGAGLTAIMLATFAQPSAIIGTDFDVEALRNMHHNFEVNGLLAKNTPFIAPDEAEGAQAAAAIYTSSGVAPKPLSPFPDQENDDTSATSAAAPPSSSPSSLCQVHTARVDWYDFSPAQIQAFDADVIIACDTTYIEPILIPFAQTVRTCLQAKPNTVAYLAQAERHPTTFMLYIEALREEGLKLEEIPTDQLPQRFNFDRDTCPVALHRITIRE